MKKKKIITCFIRRAFFTFILKFLFELNRSYGKTKRTERKENELGVRRNRNKSEKGEREIKERERKIGEVKQLDRDKERERE